MKLKIVNKTSETIGDIAPSPKKHNTNRVKGKTTKRRQFTDGSSDENAISSKKKKRRNFKQNEDEVRLKFLKNIRHVSNPTLSFVQGATMS